MLDTLKLTLSSSNCFNLLISNEVLLNFNDGAVCVIDNNSNVFPLKLGSEASAIFLDFSSSFFLNNISEFTL